MDEPTMDDWRALRVMCRQAMNDGIRSNMNVDAIADDMQHIVNRWATDRELNFAPQAPGPQHYQP